MHLRRTRAADTPVATHVAMACLPVASKANAPWHARHARGQDLREEDLSRVFWSQSLGSGTLTRS